MLTQTLVEKLKLGSAQMCTPPSKSFEYPVLMKHWVEFTPLVAGLMCKRACVTEPDWPDRRLLSQLGKWDPVRGMWSQVFARKEWDLQLPSRYLGLLLPNQMSVERKGKGESGLGCS